MTSAMETKGTETATSTILRPRDKSLYYNEEMRLKRLTYLPKATRLTDGRTCIGIYSLRLNYQALISVLLTTSQAPYCFKAERGP